MTWNPVSTSSPLSAGFSENRPPFSSQPHTGSFSPRFLYLLLLRRCLPAGPEDTGSCLHGLVCPEETNLLSMLTQPVIVRKPKPWRILKRPSPGQLHGIKSFGWTRTCLESQRGGLGSTCWPVWKCKPQPLTFHWRPCSQLAGESTKFESSDSNGAPNPMISHKRKEKDLQNTYLIKDLYSLYQEL